MIPKLYWDQEAAYTCMCMYVHIDICDMHELRDLGLSLNLGPKP